VGVHVEGDRRILSRATQCQHAELRIKDHTRRRIEHLERLRAVPGVLFKIALIVGAELGHVPPELGNAFGADHVVGRRRPLLRNLSQVGPPSERQ